MPDKEKPVTTDCRLPLRDVFNQASVAAAPQP
jgi:hypothetical protein